jgi:amino acid adenylation domain-containing protein/FkbH-like protein/non-ribosomal peptide synthase protein (TIGR01720 family)
MAHSDLQSRLGALSPEQREQLRRMLAAKRGAAGSSAAGAPAAAAQAGSIPSAGPAADYPLSFAQKRLWLQEQLSEGKSAAYNVSLAVHLRGRINGEALEAAFRVILQRHDVLRTRIVRTDGEPRQRVLDGIDWRMERWSAAEKGDGREVFRARAEALANRPFDLEGESPLRVALMSWGGDEHGLVIVLHHIACDGHSVPLVIRDLRAAYAQILRSETPAAEAPALRYVDYAIWHRAWVTSPAGEKARAYWLDRFAELPEPIELPGDAPRPAVQDFSGRHLHHKLGRSVRDRLMQVGQRQGASLFQVLLAATATFLHRYTGRTDITIGSPTAGRHHPQLEDVVGFFVNTLPLRVTIAAHESFHTVLTRVRDGVLDAFEHQGCPFDLLVQSLPLERDLSRPPLFNIMLGLNRADEEAFSLPGLECEVVPLALAASKVDLTFHFVDGPDGLELDLEYATALFSEPRLRRPIRYFATMLEGLLEVPDTPVGDIGLLRPEERRALARRFNPAPAALPPDRSLVGLFREQVGRAPAADAVVCEGRRLSYEELDRLSDRVARRLTAQLGPLRREEAIAIQVERSDRMIAALLGILKAGGCYLPINPGTPLERVSMLLTMGQVRLRLTEGEPAVPDWRGIDADLREWCDREPSPGADSRQVPAEPAPAGRSLAYIIFTSGSTGAPKGVLVEQRAVVRLVRNTDFLQLGPGDRVLQTGSLAFDASTFEIWGPLLNGGCCCLPRGKEILEVERFGDLLHATGATTCFLTTGLFNQIADFNPQAFRGLRHLLTGGEKVSVTHVNRVRAVAPELQLLHVYGPTENTTFSTWYPVRAEARGDVPIGRAIAHSTVYILDERGNLQPPGVAGEIYCGGEGIARGYLGRPELTAEKFVPDPFAARPGARLYRTGDFGRWDEEGNVEFIGRTDDQVKIRGFRIELGEIELRLRAVPGVQQAVVGARPAGGTHELVAYVVPARKLSEDGLRATLGQSLPDYMVPGRFVFLESLPLNASGKVDRRALPAPVASGDADDGAPSLEHWTVPEEKALAEVWAEVLGRAPAEREAHYFNAGGDSIKAIQMAARLRSRGFRLTLREVFARPRFGDLAAALSRAAADVPDGVTAEGEIPFTPIQCWFLEAFTPPYDHFNQATLLEARERLDSAIARRSLELLLARHAMLRCRLERTADGTGWRQHVAAAPGMLCWREEDLRGAAPEGLRAATEAVATALHRGLCLAEGRLMAAGFLRGPETDRLLLVIHHWAVDGVSWRVLLDELETTYRRLRSGETVPAVAATPFRAWAQALHRYAQDGALADEAAYWKAVSRAAGTPPSVPAEPVVEDSREVLLSADLAAAIGSAGARAYGAKVEELLLAALAQAWEECGSGGPLLLAMEGHGRESRVSPLDVSQTVGWFTSLWPFLLPRGGAWSDCIREVKDALRGVPHRGLGHGVLRYLRRGDPGLAEMASAAPRVSFNYLGAFSEAPGALFRGVVDEPTGRPAAAHLGSPFALDVVAELTGGKLRVGFHFHRAILAEDNRGDLVGAFERALLASIRHCTEAESRRSRADFTGGLATLAELDELVRTSRKQGWEIADVLPLTPMQEGMLFHAAYERTSAAYSDQVVLQLTGPIERERFEAAWLALGDQYPNLCAIFVTAGSGRPVAVVPQRSRLGFSWIDAAGEAAGVTTAQVRRVERERSFDLATGPLLRLTLVRLAPDRHEAILGFHHSVIDGWSSALIWRRLEANYRALAEGKALPVATGSFGDYLRWLRARDPQRDLAEWCRVLQGVRGGTSLPAGVPRLGAPPVETHAHVWELGRERTEQLVATARRLGTTENSLFQALWGVFLGKLHASSDVVFGATVSGRSESVPQVEEIVGLLINTIPVRVSWNEEDTFASLVERLRIQNSGAMERIAVSLADIQGGLPGADTLVKHTVVFENYPTENKAEARLWRAETVEIHDPMHFEFGLLVVPRPAGWFCRVVADRVRFPAAHLAALGRALLQVIDHCLQQPTAPVEKWSLPWPAARLRSWVVAATFTAEPVGEGLAFWLDALGLEADVRFAPFNQVLQQLLDPSSELGQNQNGCCLVLVRLEDWAGAEWDDAAKVEEALEVNGDQLVDGVRRLGERGGVGTLFVVFCPSSPRARRHPALDAKLDAVEGRLRRRLEAMGAERIRVMGSREIAARFPGVVVDQGTGNELGGVPYTEEFFAVLATEVVRRGAALTRSPLKVVALDADNTLWRGILGEDGVGGLELGPAQRRLQQMALAWRDAGRLLVLVSKNNPEELQETFQQRADFPLRWEDFVAVEAGWRPKSESLQVIARRLNLGLDSFLFIDDSSLECAEVQTALPEVTVMQLPAEEEACDRFLTHLWPADAVAATAEDRRRSELYRAEARREESRSGSQGLRDFIRQLKLVVRFHPIGEDNLERAAQLTQRTNQFNASTVRRSVSELRAWLAQPGMVGLLVEVEDRFGAYGLTGCVIQRDRAGTREIETLLLSCRVLGRGVEHEVIRRLAAEAGDAGCARLAVRFVRTARNVPAEKFLRRHAHEVEKASDGTENFIFECGAAAGIEVADETAAEPAGREEAPGGSQAEVRPAASRFYQCVATELASTEGLQQAVAGFRQRQRRRGRRAAFVAPQVGLEASVAAVWAFVLGVEQVGRHDSFFELGGHSLTAVMMLSRVNRELRVDLGLESIFAAPVLADFAVRIAGATRKGGNESVIRPAAAAPHYPLSSAQRRLWLIEQMREPGPSPFHMTAVFDLADPLDPERLTRAFQRLLGRHESLRTGMVVVAGEPRQVVFSEVPFAVEILAAESVRAFVERDFDLKQPPLLRVGLWPRGGQSWTLAVVMHHFVSDGWSIGVMAEELSAFYTRDADEQLPLPLQYKDYAVWQSRQLAEGNWRDAAEYWSARLADLPPPLEFPSDRTRPVAKRSQGAEVVDGLALSRWEELKRGAVAEGVSAFMALCAALQVVIARHARAHRFIIGTPVAGRDQPELEQQIGFYVNLLPLVAHVDEASTAREFLAKVRKTVTDALGHASYPFDRLVDDLKLPRDLSRTPVFDLLLVYQSNRRSDLALGDVRLGASIWKTHTSQYDLTFEFAETDDGLRLRIEYDTALFDEPRIVRVARQLFHVLEQMLTAPVRPLAALELCPESERARVRALERGAKFGSYSARAIPELVTQAGAESPAKPAVVGGGQRLTYGELEQRTLTVAANLRLAGVRPQEAVAVAGRRTPEFVAALLGVMRAGAVYVPLDLKHPDERLRLILTDAAIRHAIAIGADAEKRLDGLGLELVEGRGQSNAAPAPAAATPQDLAYLIYTSGSTGRPKGVEISHGAFATMIQSQIEVFGIERNDRCAWWASCAFDASLSEIFLGLASGATVVVADDAEREDATRFLAWLRDEAVTVATLPPAFLRVLQRAPLDPLRVLITAGEAADVGDTRHYAKSLRLFNAYGPTETAVCATIQPVSAGEGPSDSIPIGRPIPPAAAYVLDSMRRRVPLGVPGELYVGGSIVARGYRRASGLTEARFLPDPFAGIAGARMYRTGDLVRWREDGTLDFLGRDDMQIKLRGFRVELGEIEMVLRRLPGIRGAAVVARRRPNGLVLVAYVAGDETRLAEWREAVGQTLPNYMRPAVYVPVERLPMTTSGKLDKAALPEPKWEVQVAATPLQTEAERVLASAWAGCLTAAPAGRESDFFALGGDSIKALELSARLRRGGWVLGLAEVFAYPRLRDQAAQLSRAGAAGRVSRSGAVDLTPIQRWFLDGHAGSPLHHFNQAVYYRTARRVEPDRLRGAVRAVWRRHAALRAVFERTAAGWQQVLQSAEVPAPEVAWLEIPPGLAEESVVGEWVRRQQAGLDLAQGPLIRYGVIRGGERDRMLCITHHLVSDWVSHRILREDLEAAYAAPDGAGAELLPATGELDEWVQAAARWTREVLVPGGARAAWDRVVCACAEQPAPPAPGRYGDVAVLGHRLGPTATAALRAKVAGRPGVRAAILAALGRAHQRVFGAGSLTVQLEGHGREAFGCSPEVSQTVGWFTALYPCLLRGRADDDEAAAIARVGDTLAALPDAGQSFGLLRAFGGREVGLVVRTEVGFNYLGEFTAAADLGGFSLERDLPRDAIAPDFARDQPLDLSAWIIEGSLHLQCAFIPSQYPESAMRRWLKEMKDFLIASGRP